MKKWLAQNIYFRLYTIMLRIIVTNAWKTLKKVDGKKVCNSINYTICRWQLTHAIIEDVYQEKKEDYDNILQIYLVILRSYLLYHQPMIYTGRLTKRCSYSEGDSWGIWCSKMNLIAQKCTLQCLKCNKGFWRDGQGNICWSLHTANWWLPASSKRETRKRKIGEEDWLLSFPI